VEESPFQALVGEQIDTVSFVRDYVELWIDCAIPRALADPTGMVDGTLW
jgi:hypothetical protein